MIKEALAWIEDRIHGLPIDSEADLYTRPVFLPPEKPLATPLQTSSLLGLVQYLVVNVDELPLDDLLIEVSSTHASLFSTLPTVTNDRRRECYIQAVAPERKHPWGLFMDQDRFLIWLLSGFVRDDHLLALAELAKVASSEQTVESRDSGVSQTLTVRRGAKLAVETVEPIRTLQPYRTFAEVDEPQSHFLLRVKDSAPPQFALFTADGDAWQLEAARLVASYLRRALSDNDLEVAVIGG